MNNVLNRIRRAFIIPSVIIFIFILFWAAAKWPVNPDLPTEKGILYWGQQEFNYEYPVWINNLAIIGLVLFSIGFIIFLANRNNRNYFLQNLNKLLSNFIGTILEIFLAAIIILILFSNIGFYTYFKIILLIISFIPFTFILYIKGKNSIQKSRAEQPIINKHDSFILHKDYTISFFGGLMAGFTVLIFTVGVVPAIFAGNYLEAAKWFGLYVVVGVLVYIIGNSFVINTFSKKR